MPLPFIDPASEVAIERLEAFQNNPAMDKLRVLSGQLGGLFNMDGAANTALRQYREAKETAKEAYQRTLEKVKQETATELGKAGDMCGCLADAAIADTRTEWAIFSGTLGLIKPAPLKAFDARMLEAAKRNPAGHPVHIVGEEALNFRFNDIAADMETMRGLKISADLYIQSFNGLIRKLGLQTANSIEAYSDIKIYAGLTSLDRARHVSDMLAETTIRKQDYSFKDDVADINVSSGELGRRLATADEIFAMDRADAWVFVRGLRPMKLTMIDYGRVGPWRDEVADNPLEGTRLRGEAAFTIRYPQKDASGKGSAQRPVIEGIRYASTSAKRKRRFVAPVRLKHLLWLPPVLALAFVDLASLPTPHIRFSGTYSGSPDAGLHLYHRCTYVGFQSRTITPPDGNCSAIGFFSNK